VLTEQELEQKPDNIEGLEGLDETWCAWSLKGASGVR